MEVTGTIVEVVGVVEEEGTIVVCLTISSGNLHFNFMLVLSI